MIKKVASPFPNRWLACVVAGVLAPLAACSDTSTTATDGGTDAGTAQDSSPDSGQDADASAARPLRGQRYCEILLATVSPTGPGPLPGRGIARKLLRRKIPEQARRRWCLRSSDAVAFR